MNCRKGLLSTGKCKISDLFEKNTNIHKNIHRSFI